MQIPFGRQFWFLKYPPPPLHPRDSLGEGDYFNYLLWRVKITPSPGEPPPRGWGWGRLLQNSKLASKWSYHTKFELSNTKTTATNIYTWNSRSYYEKKRTLCSLKYLIRIQTLPKKTNILIFRTTYVCFISIFNLWSVG